MVRRIEEGAYQSKHDGIHVCSEVTRGGHAPVMTSLSDFDDMRASHARRDRSQSAIGALASPGAAALPPTPGTVDAGTGAPQSTHEDAPMYTRPVAQAWHLNVTASSTTVGGGRTFAVTGTSDCPGNACSQRRQPQVKP